MSDGAPNSLKTDPKVLWDHATCCAYYTSYMVCLYISIRLSYLLQISTMPVFLLGSALNVGCLLAAPQRTRAILPILMLAVSFLALLSMEYPQSALLLSLVFIVENVLTVSVLIYISNDYRFENFGAAPKFAAVVVIVPIAGASLRAVVRYYSPASTISILQYGILDWSAEVPFLLTLTPIILQLKKITVISICRKEALITIFSCVLNIVIPTSLSFGIGLSSAMSATYLTILISIVCGSYNGVLSLCLTCSTGFIATVGVYTMNPNVHNVNLADYTLISQAFTFGQVLGLVLVTFLFISDKEKCLRLTVESKAASDRGLYEDEVQKLKDKNILQFNSVVFAFKQINEQVTSLLLSLKDTEGNHEYQPLMQNIVGWKSDAANILSFSDDMMYLVRLQAKAVRLKPSKTNLSLFFTATISSLQSLLERNKILFQWLVEKLPETVYIDAVALQRILYHLVLKRECSPKVVSLRIRSTSCCYDTHDENFLHITVSCEGQKFELPLGQSLGSRLVEELLALFKGTVTQEIQTSTSMQIKLKIPYTTESVYEEDTVPFLDFSSAPFMAGKIYMHSMKLQSQNYFLDSFHSTNSTLRSSKSVVRRGGERRGSGFSTKSFKKHVTIEENPQPISRNASLYGSYRGSLRRNLMVPPVITLEKSPNISTSSSFENINSLNTIQGTQSGSTLTRLQAKALSQSVNFNGSDDVLGLEQARLSRSISTGQKSILKNGGGTLKRVSYHEGRRSSLRSTENIFVESVSTSSQDRSLTFLLADKSTVFRKLLANMLKPHSIREAENETDILNLCAKDKFDAIFMDFDFSIVLDLAKNLVNDRLHPPAIVLITSQTISSKEKRILTLAGVFQILEKPITKDMIAECLKSLSLSLVQSNASSNTLNHAITTAVKSETSLRRKSTTNIHNRSSAVQFKHGHIYQSRMNNDNRITEQNETNLAHNRSSTTDVVMIDVHEDSPLEANVEKTPVFLHVMSNDTITN